MEQKSVTDRKPNDNEKMKLYAGDFLKSFKKFWWIILVFVVLFGGFGAARQYFSYSPTYKATATFTVNTQKATSVGGVWSFITTVQPLHNLQIRSLIF